MASPGVAMKKRLLFLMLAFTSLVIALIVRVGWIQIVEGEKYQEMAFEQQNRDREITPKRGSIMDKNMKILAMSATVERIVANPQEIKNCRQMKRKELPRSLHKYCS